MIKITEGEYKDQKAIVLESGQLKATFLPEIGAKMASLVFKPLQKELLVGNLLGILSGEWKEAPQRAKTFLYIGMAVLIISVIVISFST